MTASYHAYLTSARQRQQQQREKTRQRWQAASQVAQQAAAILKQEFGVQKVVLFGSALDSERFHADADIDLAVWALPPDTYLQAVARLLDLSDFSIDLVEVEHAKDYIKTAIAAGREL